MESAPLPYPVSEEAKQPSEPSYSAEPPSSLIRALRDFHAHDVNLAPTLALCVPIFTVFMCLSVFLETHILLTSSSFLAIFFVGAYIVFSSYFVAHHYMFELSSSYRSIPNDKKFYVLSNLIKSAALLAYTPSAAYTLYLALVRDEWSTPRIRAMGVLYAIPDAVSLLLVTRMAFSTKVHHICVILFMAVNLYVTYEHETVGRALVVYAVFSTFAYLVNLLLATRFLPVSSKLSLILSVLALAIYASCLAINWTWQLRFLSNLVRAGPSMVHGAAITVYVLLISLVVRDDVVLVAWLWKNVKGKTVEARSPLSLSRKRSNKAS